MYVCMGVYIIAALRFLCISMMMSVAGDLPSVLVISACQTMSPAKDQREENDAHNDVSHSPSLSPFFSCRNLYKLKIEE
jgi:hypothetical protein